MLRFFGRSSLRMTCRNVILNVAKRNEESNFKSIFAIKSNSSGKVKYVFWQTYRMLYLCDVFAQHLESQEIRGEPPYLAFEERLIKDRHGFHKLNGILPTGRFILPPPSLCFRGESRCYLKLKK